MSKKRNECIIPEEAIADPNSREIFRGWIANEGLHVSFWIPEGWKDPGHWGVVMADMMRHVADAYQKSQGADPKATIARIREMIEAEMKALAERPKGGFVQE